MKPVQRLWHCKRLWKCFHWWFPAVAVSWHYFVCPSSVLGLEAEIKQEHFSHLHLDILKPDLSLITFDPKFSVRESEEQKPAPPDLWAHQPDRLDELRDQLSSRLTSWPLTARGGLNAGLPYLEGLSFFVLSVVTLLVFHMLPLNNHLMVLLSLSAPPKLWSKNRKQERINKHQEWAKVFLIIQNLQNKDQKESTTCFTLLFHG